MKTPVFLMVLGASLVLTIFTDHLIGMFLPKNPSLIFPPRSQVFYNTNEFQFTASINSLGFRDRSFTVTKSSNYRILAIGDSFTYGWGVDLENSWPKVLEHNLRANGWQVEIANLGKPSADPVDYADIAERAIPLLKPDLVVLGILQGEDLAQLSLSGQSQDRSDADNWPGLRIVLSRTARKIYPNTLHATDALRGRDSSIEELSVNQKWAEDAKKALGHFTAAERARYEKIDEHVKSAFVKGILNPGLVYYGVRYPDYFLRTFDLTQVTTRAAMNKMSDQLMRIRKIADGYNTKVIAVSTPYGIYVSDYIFESRKRFGFTLVNEMLSTDAADEAIRVATTRAQLPFFTFTKQARDLVASGARLYFELDGHFNASGYNFFANQLTPLLRNKINTSSVYSP